MRNMIGLLKIEAVVHRHPCIVMGLTLHLEHSLIIFEHYVLACLLLGLQKHHHLSFALLVNTWSTGSES